MDERKKFFWYHPDASLHPLLTQGLFPHFARRIHEYGVIRKELKPDDYDEYLTSSDPLERALALHLQTMEEQSHG